MPSLAEPVPAAIRTVMSYRYTVAVSHKGLGKHRIISGIDRFSVESKAIAQKPRAARCWHLQGGRVAEVKGTT
jgi:hypothetical protein